MQHTILFKFVLDCEEHGCATPYQATQKAIELVKPAIDPEAVFPAREREPESWFKSTLKQLFG